MRKRIANLSEEETQEVRWVAEHRMAIDLNPRAFDRDFTLEVCRRDLAIRVAIIEHHALKHPDFIVDASFGCIWGDPEVAGFGTR